MTFFRKLNNNTLSLYHGVMTIF